MRRKFAHLTELNLIENCIVQIYIKKYVTEHSPISINEHISIFVTIFQNVHYSNWNIIIQSRLQCCIQMATDIKTKNRTWRRWCHCERKQILYIFDLEIYIVFYQLTSNYFLINLWFISVRINICSFNKNFICQLYVLISKKNYFLNNVTNNYLRSIYKQSV